LVTASERADVLNEYLATVSTVDDGVAPRLAPRVNSGISLSSIHFTNIKI